jgi:hypothetical protein
MNETLPGTHQKALAINLDPGIYGTIAEIGAGQEVARWFLRVGGASGTVAKTISAYDMSVSDSIYGKASRYVSRDRVVKMLDHEYNLLQERLGSTKEQTAALFAFADTISARNFSGTNDCHGWLGIRFQRKPGGPVHDMLLHVNLRDSSNVQQQEAVGIMGTNLIWLIRQDCTHIEHIIQALLDNIGSERVEIDVLQISGPEFSRLDDFQIQLALAQMGCAPAIHIPAQGEPLPTAEICYKRSMAIVPLAKESFVQDGNARLADIVRHVREHVSSDARPTVPLLTTSVRHIGIEGLDPDVGSRLAAMKATGSDILLSAHPEIFRLSEYLRRYTAEPIHIGLGAGTVAYVLHQDDRAQPKASLLLALAMLLGQNARLVVWPMRGSKGELIGLNDQDIPLASRHLLAYLREAAFLHELSA